MYFDLCNPLIYSALALYQNKFYLPNDITFASAFSMVINMIKFQITFEEEFWDPFI